MNNERWWSGLETERFWLEATDRVDIGQDLRAPQADDSGADNWRYTLFKEVQSGDIVLHYDKHAGSGGIIGFSTVAGPWEASPIIWAARGSYARNKGTQPHERPGFILPLQDFTRLPEVLSLDDIRAKVASLRLLVGQLQDLHKKPLYFPFELTPKRPPRLLQGYAFKIPSSFIHLFPSLSEALGVQVAESVQTDTRNPPWSRDELILALELYLRDPISVPGKSSTEIFELSALLNELGKQTGALRGDAFRNPNGVYMKLMNFRRFDPTFQAVGKSGLSRGGKEEEIVWNEFAHDRSRIAMVAEAIRNAVKSGGAVDEPYEDRDSIAEAVEGRILTRLHQIRERDRRLIERRKAKALRINGRLSCEACGFDFAEKYGVRGKGFIECHHIRPVHTLSSDGERTSEDDLALVCANCHRMIHASRPWLSLEALKAILKPTTSS
jgi:5-methylcytosine-specific restriction protein A